MRYETSKPAFLFVLAGVVFALAACQVSAQNAATEPPPEGLSTAIFAGGCFWCMEPPFDELEGVHGSVSGYTGGRIENPTYQQVSGGTTEHAEAVEILYDPEVITYEELLAVFWRNVDPTTDDRQFCDRGRQYRTGIFVQDDAERLAAEASKARIEAEKTFEGPVLTEIVDAGPFYRAEEYHQDFYVKSPTRYKSYRSGCGRDARLEELWGG